MGIVDLDGATPSFPTLPLYNGMYNYTQIYTERSDRILTILTI